MPQKFRGSYEVKGIIPILQCLAQVATDLLNFDDEFKSIPTPKNDMVRRKRPITVANRFREYTSKTS